MKKKIVSVLLTVGIISVIPLPVLAYALQREYIDQKCKECADAAHKEATDNLCIIGEAMKRVEERISKLEGKDLA